MQLTNPHRLSKAFPGLRSDAIKKILEESNIEPKAQSPGPRPGSVTAWYEEDEARAAIGAHLEKQRAVAPPAPAPTVDLEPLRGALENLHQDMVSRTGALDACFDALSDDVRGLATKMTEQNAVLLKAIEKLTAEVTQLRAAGPAIDLDFDDPPALPAPAPAANDPKPPARKLKVAIVGVLLSQAAALHKEFADAFEIQVYSATDTARRTFIDSLNRFDVVIVMTTHAHKFLRDVPPSPPYRLLRVANGIPELRDLLTRLFVEAADKKAA